MYPFSFIKKYGPLTLLGAAAWVSVTIFLISLAPPGQRTAATVAAVERAVLERVAPALMVLTEQERVAAVLKDADRLELGVRQKTTDCTINGPYQDMRCSPGAIFPDATPEKICVSGYTKTVRSVSTKTKGLVYAAYGISYPQPTGSYEMDHIIPLALGGNNDVSNLYPEAAEPKPGFREKDVVEVYLHEEMCAGRVDLSAAQRQIAKDWLKMYNALDAASVSRIRQKYTSWAN